MTGTLGRRRTTDTTLVLRLAFLAVLATLAQTLVFPNLRVFGVVPDVGLVAAVAVAFTRGPEVGVAYGFLQGLAIDLFLNSPFGLSALAFGLTAFGVGIFTESLVRTPRFVSMPLTFVAGLVSGAIFVAVGGLFGQDHLYEWESIRIVVLAAVYSAVIAPPVFWCVGRLLRSRDV